MAALRPLVLVDGVPRQMADGETLPAIQLPTHGHGSADLTDATPAGRALLTAADAAAQRAGLGLGSAATAAYEEGSWTPVPVPNTGAIASYTSAGRYVRIGTFVQVSFTCAITNVGTAGGGISISGLPFAISTATGRIAGCGIEDGVTASMLFFYGDAGGTTFNVSRYDGVLLLSNGHRYTGQLTYRV